MHILSADIGGTNVRFAIIQMGRSEEQKMPFWHILHFSSFPSARYTSASQLLHDWQKSLPETKQALSQTLQAIVIGAAGHIINGRCKLTNLSWSIDTRVLSDFFGSEKQVFLLNDFFAQGFAAFLLPQLKADCLLAASNKTTAPIAILGAGTGLGKALALPGTCQVLASEGGQAEFPFIGAAEYAYALFLAKRRQSNNLTGDMVVSGSGLEALYAFHCKKELPAEAIAKELAVSPKVHEWFVRFYARACRNYLLDTLAGGGLVISGGIAAKVPVVRHPLFLNTLYNSKHQRGFLQSIPVWHLHDAHAGLLGAAYYTWLQLQKSL